MKKIIIIVFIILLNTNKSSAQSLEGNWTVFKFESAPISAMDDIDAKKWLQHNIIIKNGSIIFNNKINDVLNNFNLKNCKIKNENKPFKKKAEDYFDKNINFEKIAPFGSSVLIYETSCDDSPFSNLILNSKNEIIISWDGVFFFLRK
jgi:hypothetical protein